jgi:DNA-binding NtrC family response regulator
MAKPLVVLVDDDRSWCEAVTHLLRGEGCEVRSASDGRQGLALIAELTPSLILLDPHMPTMGGLELLQHLQRRAIRTPVIVVTGESEPSAIPNALAAGAADALRKPVSADVLRWTVRRVIKLETRRISGSNKRSGRSVA